MDYENMNNDEIKSKIESGEFTYNGSTFIKHEDNFNMTRALVVSGRKISNKSKTIDGHNLANMFGYDSVEVTGVGIEDDAYTFLGYAIYKLNKFKKLIVNIDVVDYMEAIGVTNMSNKARFTNGLMSMIDSIMNTGYRMRIKGKTFGRKIIVGYDVDHYSGIITIYFDPAYVEFQSNDVYIVSSNVKKNSEIKKSTSTAVLDILLANNYLAGVNELDYTDLRAGIVSTAKKPSHIKADFKKAFDELLDLGFVSLCEFAQLKNGQTVVKFKLTSKATAYSNHEKQAKGILPAPVAAPNPVTSKSAIIEAMPVDYDSMSMEENLKALEIKITSIGVNPEYLASLKEHEAAQADENAQGVDFYMGETGNVDWDSFDEEKFYGTPDKNDICDDGLPF